jgi:hypothetical protein
VCILVEPHVLLYIKAMQLTMMAMCDVYECGSVMLKQGWQVVQLCIAGALIRARGQAGAENGECLQPKKRGTWWREIKQQHPFERGNSK